MARVVALSWVRIRPEYLSNQRMLLMNCLWNKIVSTTFQCTKCFIYVSSDDLAAAVVVGVDRHNKLSYRCCVIALMSMLGCIIRPHFTTRLPLEHWADSLPKGVKVACSVEILTRWFDTSTGVFALVQMKK